MKANIDAKQKLVMPISGKEVCAGYVTFKKLNKKNQGRSHKSRTRYANDAWVTISGLRYKLQSYTPEESRKIGGKIRQMQKGKTWEWSHKQPTTIPTNLKVNWSRIMQVDLDWITEGSFPFKKYIVTEYYVDCGEQVEIFGKIQDNHFILPAK